MSDVNMGNALDLLEECRIVVKQLDGIAKDTQTPNNKERMSNNAQRSRLLLYAAYLADAARLEIQGQYHRFKGEEPPTVTL